MTEPDADAWVVLAGAGAGGADERPPSLRRAAVQFGVIAALLVVAVGAIGAVVIRHVAQQQSVHNVAEVTDVLGQSVVQPALTDAMATDPAAATATLDRVLRPSLRNRLLVRVKVWTPTGLVLYSDEPRLIGRTFPLDHEATDAFADARTEADISNLDRPENRYERGQGALLEVYRPVWTPGGRELLLETYFRYATVQQNSAGLWRGFAGILLSSIIALLVLLIPPAGLLLRRTRRAQLQRQAMAQRALEASDEERRRIGASLHDGVVQQLVAASFDLSGRAERARGVGDHERAGELREVAGTVRGTIGGLRSLLVEIYPPGVGAGGLAAAVRDLARTAADGAAEITVDVDEATAARLSPAAREDAFRVTQECLRNAVKHARARTISIRLAGRPDTPERWARLEIADDGVGFDAAAAAASAEAGHLGLQLIAHAARRCGAELAVSSRPGHGTRLRMDVPL